MWTLHRADLDALELGARVLGSGGAGDPYLMRMLLEASWRTGAPVRVWEPGELDPATSTLAVGLVGSVTAFAEKPAEGQEFARAFTRLRALLPPGSAVTVCGYETAGVNAFTSLLVAAQLGVDVLDVDGMGRGLSWVDQTTFASAGRPICPFVLTEPAGQEFVIDRTSATEAERFMRLLTVSMGGWSAFAGYPMTAGQAAGCGVHNALRRCLDLGRALLRARRRCDAGASLGPALADEVEDCTYIGSGRVTDIRWSYAGGYPEGTVVVWLTGADPRPLRIEARNEFLLVLDRGRLRARVPEIIVLLGASRSAPLLAEQVTRGTEVDVVVLAAPAKWCEPGFAGDVAPARFGYDLPAGTDGE